MSVNSSSSSPSTNMHEYLQYCMQTDPWMLTAYTVICILILLPLFIRILCVGFQRWRQQHSGTVMSNSDLFTYHMVVLELTGVSGFTLSCVGVHTHLVPMLTLGICIFIINLVGQMLFHILTCVERYLAVVHPITYLNLRKEKGIRIRNITIGCVWMASFASTSLLLLQNQVLLNTMSYCFVALSIILIFFCSLSVLCVLIRPRPGDGDGGGARQRVDQSKLRAFYTIIAILGVLLFRLAGNIVTTALYDLPQIGDKGGCALWFSVVWFSLPSSLVSPLLFLHRTGKLLCCKNNNSAVQE